nr:hypothetical protein [uncultured Celeribacter sp.]
MLPPLVSNVVRAPGLRAEQLAFQAKTQMDRVIYVMPKSRYDLLARANTVIRSVNAHPDFLVLHDDKIDIFFERIERSAIVFTQLEMVPIFRQALKKHFVIYDVLAPRALEFIHAGASEEKIKQTETLHVECLTSADRVFVNGPKTMELFSEELSALKSVCLNPFTPLPAKNDHKAPTRENILFFSGGQKWTNNAPFLKAMAEVLEHQPEQQAFLMSPHKHHEDPESVGLSRLLQLPNVRRVTGLSYPAHLALLKSCYGVMDWSVVNEERTYSTSTRLIQSVSVGTPIFANAQTGLDRIWAPFPGMTSQNEPDPEQLMTFISAAKKGQFDTALQYAKTKAAEILNDPSLFGDIS